MNVIEPASLIGFALVFIATSWLSSALACGGGLLARRWIARRGTAAERSVAASALLVAPLVALAITIVLAIHSVAAWYGGGDHCATHGHHPHLCLIHGGGWSGETWAVASAVLVGGIAALGLAHQLMRSIVAAARLRRLAAVAREVAPDTLLVPADSGFCFVGGTIAPRVYISAATWDALDDHGRGAVLAHERAHVAQRDVLWHAMLAAVARLGAPLLARRVLGCWSEATERHCDRAAARAVDEITVANALVTLARLHRLQPGMSFGDVAVAPRVEALLRRPVDDDPVASGRIAWATRGALLILFGAAIVFVDPLHHALETLLGHL